MPLTLRLRFEGRAATLSGISEDMTVGNLRVLLAEKTGVPPDQQSLKCGVPPSPLKEFGTLAQAGCVDRDTLILEKKVATADDDVLLISSSADQNTQTVPESSAAKRPRQTSIASADAMSLPRTTSSTAPVSSQDPRGPELLRAFDRAIRVSEEHVKMLPEDKHQLFALRKGKSAVLANMKQGSEISLSALHTLRGVGHWVVQQVRDQVKQPAASLASQAGRSSKPAAAPTPNSFQWWYVGKNGKPVECRNDAKAQGPIDAQEFLVGILHSSGRREKAYLPDAKAPPRCPPLPTFATGK